MLWFDNGRNPPGKWRFLQTVGVGLSQLKESLVDSVNLTEGNEAITITGCLEAYRQTVLCRVMDFSQAVGTSWNADQTLGSVVCTHALLETLATFHFLSRRAQCVA